MTGIVAWGGLGWVTVVGAWHEHVMIDGVTGDNGVQVGSGRRAHGSAELQAKERLGLRFSRT